MAPGIVEEDMNFNLRKYNVSYNTGFMLESPLTSLPHYFEPWNHLAASVPSRLKTKTLRDAVHELPQLDHRQLVGHRQLRLAHLQLSYITSGYVWQDGDHGVPQLPKNLAVPLYKISQELGIQPILSTADLGLANWKLTHSDRPRDFENLECICHPPGDSEGDWFCIVTFMVEFNFSNCLKPMAHIIETLDTYETARDDSLNMDTTEDQVTRYLDELTDAIATMKAAFVKMHDNLQANTFFNVLRPFLMGWGGKGNPLPDGLIYEGVSEQPLKFLGSSEAQSGTLQLLDGFLGVQHTEDKRETLLHMRSYMLPGHRAIIEDVERRETTLRNFVLSSRNKSLHSAYNRCLSAVVNFRSYHLQIVTKYIVAASRHGVSGQHDNDDLKGTGGTNLIPFLKGLRSDTEDAATVPHDKKTKFSIKREVIIAAFVITGVITAINLSWVRSMI
ncbi:myoglobin-like [Physella acuta]|uniref:myoglobin-like n=1 Tax=Physella acuta TaxID=109671 RepID=UPI0027DB4288|nr:myoglobin-like [Physella acuta]